MVYEKKITPFRLRTIVDSMTLSYSNWLLNNYKPSPDRRDWLSLDESDTSRYPTDYLYKYYQEKYNISSIEFFED
jgi:hypothetical protein